MLEDVEVVPSEIFFRDRQTDEINFLTKHIKLASKTRQMLIIPNSVGIETANSLI